MILRKWNFKKHDYEPYEIPDDCVCPMLAPMDYIVNCVECLKKLPFGDCYTSRKIHNQVGFGYSVCEQCYEKEFAEEEKYRDGQK